jgi:hypothetical protein
MRNRSHQRIRIANQLRQCKRIQTRYPGIITSEFEVRGDCTLVSETLFVLVRMDNAASPKPRAPLEAIANAWNRRLIQRGLFSIDARR